VPGHRAARAKPRHEDVDQAVGLFPDFRPGGLVMRLRVRLVEILVRLKGARDLVAEALGDRVVAFGRVARHRRWTDDHLGAVGAQQRDLLGGLFVRHHEDHAIAPQGRRHRQGVAGIPGRRLDDRAARLQQPATLRILDHPHADPVFHAAARIERLDLGKDGRLQSGGDAMEPHQRRVPDGLQDALQDLHSGHSKPG